MQWSPCLEVALILTMNKIAGVISALDAELSTLKRALYSVGTSELPAVQA